MVKNIFLIEDNPADVETFRRAIDRRKQEINLKVKSDGIGARDFLINLDEEQIETGIHLVLLDFNLPGIDGRKLLAEFFDTEKFWQVPVVIVTTSSNIRDIRFAYANGANAYVVKPGRGFKFLEYIESICDFWLPEG